MAKLPCPPELWPEFSALLDEALDLEKSERPAWLAGLGPEHAAVLPWLIKVLATRDGRDESEFLQTLIISGFSQSEFASGQQVGIYLLEQRLGIGGMGEVWLATRSDGKLKRQVALKLPHSELFAGVLRRRFERERDILAALSHSNIAQLYDAGVADTLHPFLAMEYVDGVSILDHCNHARLSLDRRLELFLQILEAVGYAHSRLVAHRDIKPSNILVTRDGRIKLLDFGIAKLLASDPQAPIVDDLTRVSGCAATPGYAAPEQLAGEPITVAVDLYALGVVLYELVTGQRPFQDVRPNTARLDAPRASSNIDAGHADQVGGLDAKHLRRAVSGDLDAIIAKAMEPNPEQRYRTAEAFAQDLERSRDHRPISARRLSFARLSLKFARRNSLAVAMSASLLLVLLLGSAGIAWQAVRAEHEAERATTIKDFLISVFRASDPRIAKDKPRGEMTVGELLDASSAQIENGFSKEPETQVELLGVTADIYRALHETRKSAELYRQETQLASARFGVSNVHAIDGLIGQADIAGQNHDYALAIRLLGQADPLLTLGGLDQSTTRAHWLVMQGETMKNSGHLDDAQKPLEAAVELYKRVAPEDPFLADALVDLANISMLQLDYAKSAEYDQQVIAAAQKANSKDQIDLVKAYYVLALDLKNMGDFNGAAQAFSAGSEYAVRTGGTNSQIYWAIVANWAAFRYDRGDREALHSLQELTDSLPQDRTKYRSVSEAQVAADVFQVFSRCLANDGQGHAAVEQLLTAQALLDLSDIQARANPSLQLNFGIAYEAASRYVEAGQAYRVGVNQENQLRKETAHERLGRFLISQNDIDGAAREFDITLQLSGGHPHSQAVFAEAGLARVAIARSDSSAALQISGRALQHLDTIEGMFDVRIAPYVWNTRARSLLLAGEPQSALPFVQLMRKANALYFNPALAAIKESEALDLADTIAAQSRDVRH